MGTKRKTWYLRKKDILYVEETMTEGTELQERNESRSGNLPRRISRG